MSPCSPPAPCTAASSWSWGWGLCSQSLIKCQGQNVVAVPRGPSWGSGDPPIKVVFREALGEGTNPHNSGVLLGAWS